MNGTPSAAVVALRLTDFRSYAHAAVAFTPGLNVLVGPNGAGKTNLLEAIAYASVCRSPRTTRDADLVRHGATAFELQCTHAAAPDGMTHTIAVEYRSGRGRSVQLDGQRSRSLGALFGRLPVVFFSPDDLSLIKGGAAARRLLLDRLLVQASPVYADALGRYRQALQQRNATLRGIRSRVASRGLLAVWEAQLIQYGAEVLRRRAEALVPLEQIAAAEYLALAGPVEQLSCRYRPGIGATAGGWTDALALALAQSQDRDVALGWSTAGPHRDDLEIQISGQAARQYASQGQQRTAVLALKLAERELLCRLSGQLPVFCVDDVLSELDERRRGALREKLSAGGQILLTAADDEHTRRLRPESVFRVVGSRVRRACPE